MILLTRPSSTKIYYLSANLQKKKQLLYDSFIGNVSFHSYLNRHNIDLSFLTASVIANLDIKTCLREFYVKLA